MNSSISYSGINTKVKAMSAKLISKEDYNRIITLESVTDLIAYLKKHPGYHDLFLKYDEREIHRGQAERVFINGLYLDYTKIYRFANEEQRQDLELIFFRYEINVLKVCIRLIHNNSSAYDLSQFHPFFTKHSQINVNTLSTSRSMEEYIQNLKGTEYYSILTKMSKKGGLSSFDYEMALDVYYFTKSWKLKDNILNDSNKKAFTLRIGTEIDLLNIMWIFRSKKMYDMGASDIFTYLIPVNYKLTKSLLARLVSTVTLDEFMKQIGNSHYKNFSAHLKNGTMEREYNRIINNIYLYNIAKHPASMTTVNYYLFRKDMEISRLTTALECIRYGLDSKRKQDYILQ
ncbi:MAG: V-type ATPase subunit [Candidatus Gastranaerophilales bacterium]|nr:V-type ATPase subunit [Candidatus Gastranaerophilales bacterium]